jgi:hypothetical protein
MLQFAADCVDKQTSILVTYRYYSPLMGGSMSMPLSMNQLVPRLSGSVPGVRMEGGRGFSVQPGLGAPQV